MKAARLASIDMLRGVVIVLMALDHTRDFFGLAPFAPEDLSQTTPGWFMTRWVTHLCATVFVFLAGCSAWLRGARAGHDVPRDARPALSRYLLGRGAMLLALEWTWISFSWQFGYDVTIFQVIWALGAGMIVLAGLLWLPRWAIAAFAALLIGGHNTLDGWQPGGLLWQALHQGGFYHVAGNYGFVFVYPLIPWLGVMAAGYAAAPVFRLPAPERQRRLLWSAAALLALFIVLRTWNLYGDPAPWAPQDKGFAFDVLSYLRVSKYPPSLQYLCVTGGIGLVLLAAFEHVRTVRPLMVFGASPLFFYTVHIALIHLLAGVYFIARYGETPTFIGGVLKLPPSYTPSLAVTYAAWLAMLAVMYGITLAWQRRAVPPLGSGVH